MPTISMTGNDSVKINNRNITDLADGDCVGLTFPNECANIKTGKNGNAMFALNETGRQSEVLLRVVRGSADDKFLNNLYALQQNNFPAFVLMTGEFVKLTGDGQGNVGQDTYINSGGIFSKGIEAKSNVEGDTEQSVSIYTFKFANSPRVLT